MNSLRIILTRVLTGVVLSAASFSVSFAQPASVVKPAETGIQSTEISRESKEQAYQKLFEAQRYILKVSPKSTPATNNANTKLAKQALTKAVELNPNLSEAYTALAEIAPDIDEAKMLAGIAVKINPDNFGGQRILARINTLKSQLQTKTIDAASAQKAVESWNEITRLDPRNAEAWAFLSFIYEKLNQNDLRIKALQKWLAATTPVSEDTRFYRYIVGRSESMEPDAAGLKLGEALIATGKFDEAIDILSQAVADQPDNATAIDLLRQAIQSTSGRSSQKTLEMLQQAVYANPTNLVLVELLSDTQLRLGKPDDALKTLKSLIERVGDKDRVLSANLQVSLGDIYSQTNRHDEAISQYEKSLVTYGIEKNLTTDDQREFATRVFEKMLKTYKNAGKGAEFKILIQRARTVLGKSDLFADKQMISALRESGKKQEALLAVRNVRRSFPDDYGLLRTEATILTDIGRVNEGVALVKTLMQRKNSVPSPYFDDFSNNLFISGLFSQAGKNNNAIEFARLAIETAKSAESKQLASIALANALHRAGNHQEAESTMRELLKKTPKNPIALNNLGYFLLDRDEKLDEAVDLIQQAIRIDPTNSSYLDSLGWGFFKLGKFDESEIYLKEAIRYNSSSFSSYEHLGDLYLKLGKRDQAKDAWQKALGFANNTDGLTRIKSKLSLATKY